MKIYDHMPPSQLPSVLGYLYVDYWVQQGFLALVMLERIFS